jgi:hypothetical protein
LDEERIAVGVPERVVDLLEPVEVDHDHREGPARALCITYRLLEPIVEQNTIRKPREGVMQRHMTVLPGLTAALAQRRDEDVRKETEHQ